MDAKNILPALKKHYFWICCGVIVLVTFSVWWIACSSLREETEDRIADINTAFSSGEQVTRVTNHPNQTSHDGTDELIQLASREVYEAWQEQANHQQAVLVWPPELGADFIAKVADKWPIEKLPYPTENEIDVWYRERYRNYVDSLVPKLAEAVGARWYLNEQETTEPIVMWEDGDQRRLMQDHFSWPDQPSQAPTTLQMLYAQETLWALTEIMHIIQRTNGDVDARYQAAIKRIYSISLSQDAVARAGNISSISGGRAGGGDGGGMMPGGMPEGMPGGDDAPPSSYGGAMAPGAMGSDGGGGGGGSAQASGITGSPGGGGQTALAPTRDPADYRYVDPKDFTPLTGEKIRNALKSDDPDSAFLVVAKRMPVRLRVNMDQRKLNRLLAECGNADLPVEIRQVRINRPPAPVSGRSGGGMGGMGGMGGGMDMALGGDGAPGMDPGGMGAMGGGPPGMSGGIPGMDGGDSYGMPGMGAGGTRGSSGGRRLSDSSPYDVDVELWGLIYIYNPVDMDKLGIERKGEEAAAESAAGEDPQAAPPADAAGQAAPAELPPAAAAPADGGAPAGQGPPAAEQGAPAGQGAPADGGAPAPGGQAPPAGQGAPPAGQGAPPAGQGAPPAGQAPPGGGNPPPPAAPGGPVAQGPGQAGAAN